MKEKSITWKQFLSFGPCYKGEELEKLREFAKSKPRWTALDILSCKQFPTSDRLWLVLRQELIENKTIQLLACDFAERPLKRDRKAGREPAKASWDAVAVARKFATGEATRYEMDVAAYVAYAAADAAANAAAERRWQVARTIRVLKKAIHG